MKILIGIFILLFALPAFAETRCGWYDNSSPGDRTLDDRDGSWTISEQGGYEAAGVDRISDFPARQWVVTNSGGHGHGCGCIKGNFNVDEQQVTMIEKFTIKSLSSCRDDKNLHEP